MCVCEFRCCIANFPGLRRSNAWDGSKSDTLLSSIIRSVRSRAFEALGIRTIVSCGLTEVYGWFLLLRASLSCACCELSVYCTCSTDCTLCLVLPVQLPSVFPQHPTTSLASSSLPASTEGRLRDRCFGISLCSRWVGLCELSRLVLLVIISCTVLSLTLSKVCCTTHSCCPAYSPGKEAIMNFGPPIHCSSDQNSLPVNFDDSIVNVHLARCLQLLLVALCVAMVTGT